MIDVKTLKDPCGLLNNLYNKLYNVKNELEKRMGEIDYYYMSQDYMMYRVELDAIQSLIKYIENYDKNNQ